MAPKKLSRKGKGLSEKANTDIFKGYLISYVEENNKRLIDINCKLDGHISTISEDVKSINEKISGLNEFKIKIYAIAATVSAIMAFVVNLFFLIKK